MPVPNGTDSSPGKERQMREISAEPRSEFICNKDKIIIGIQKVRCTIISIQSIRKVKNLKQECLGICETSREKMGFYKHLSQN